jgi:hypothetical protein
MHAMLWEIHLAPLAVSFGIVRRGRTDSLLNELLITDRWESAPTGEVLVLDEL